LEDAGAAYIFDREAGTGARFFDFETVLDRAGNAEYWLNPGVADSLQSLLNQDERFSEFAAVQEGRVYNYTRRVGPAGGFDYFESGPSNPDVVLADLISIFHPDLLPDHERFYYERLD
jgi:iron complex transport system substrate-binding protein